MKPKILIVDDHPTNLKLAREVLHAAGFEVHVAGSAEETLSLLPLVAPHLVLLDIALPGMDGLQLAETIRARHDGSIVIAAMTAHAMKGDDQRAYDAGCHAYFAKPIDTRNLPARLRELVDARFPHLATHEDPAR